MVHDIAFVNHQSHQRELYKTLEKFPAYKEDPIKAVERQEGSRRRSS